MTRPMPGPPECLPPVHDLSRPPAGPDGKYDWDTWRRWREQDDWEWRIIQDKRLTDAECAAEYWREVAHLYGSPPHSSEMLRVRETKRIWARFATRPHALEEA